MGQTIIVSPPNGSDDTQTIQDALDVFSSHNETGEIQLQWGTYQVNQTLLYRGRPAHALCFGGPPAISRGLHGCRLLWTGSPGGTMIEWRGANESLLHDVALHGNNLAKHGFYARFDHEVPAGSSGIRLANVKVNNVVGPASACVNLGSDELGANYQVSEVRMQYLNLQGAQHGIVTGSANAKNFSLHDSAIGNCTYGIVHGYDPSNKNYGGGSGFFTCSGVQFGHNSGADIYQTTGNFSLIGGGSEESYRVAVGTTGNNPGVLTLSGFYWESNVGPIDDIIIDYTGTIILTGSYFANRRTITSQPKIRRAGLSSYAPAKEPVTVISRGCTYRQTQGDFAPILGDGNVVLTDQNASQYNVSSQGDLAYDQGLGTRHLKPLLGMMG